LNKANLNKFLMFLKVFSATFIFAFLGGLTSFLIINKGFNHLFRNIGFIHLSFYPFGIAFWFSLISMYRYEKYSAKVMYEDIINKDVTVEIQKVMKKMHWSVKQKDSKQIIFKSRVVTTFWMEYLEVTINENDLELVGPKYYVEKLVKKLKQ
jgi:hypothetical protein